MKIILLESPYYTLRGNQAAKALYGDVMSLRSEGYEKFHGHGCWPFSVADMAAHHFIAVQEFGENLVPFMSLQFLDMDTIREFNLDLPTSKTVATNGRVGRELESFIARELETSKNMCFCTSLTYQKPFETALKKDRISYFVHRLVHLAVWKLFIKYRWDSIFCTINLKAQYDKQCREFGFDDVGIDPVIHEELNGVEALPMIYRMTNPESHRVLYHENRTWGKRLELLRSTEELKATG